MSAAPLAAAVPDGWVVKPGDPVLVVDDSDEIRAVVTAVLEDQGYDVHVAVNGAEALAAIEAHPPCMLLLDMRMPVLDGWAVAASLRERGVRVPIAVMTAAHDAQRCCDEIGADACLPKPFDLDHLVATVDRFCGGASARRAGKSS